MVQEHELVAVDAAGELCACGVRGDLLEHLVDVVLFEMGGDPPEGVLMVDEDARWAVEQQRRHNLASFSRSAPEPVRKPAPFRPTLEQLAIAERVELGREAA